MGNGRFTVTLHIKDDVIKSYKKLSAVPIDMMLEEETANLISEEEYKKEYGNIEDLIYTYKITKYAHICTWDMDFSKKENLDVFLKRKDLLGNYTQEEILFY